MLVFDTADRAEYADVLLQRKPVGVRLDKCLAEAAEEGNAAAFGLALGGLAEAAQWFAGNDFAHHNICSKNIYAAPDGGLTLVNYCRASHNKSHNDLAAFGALAAALYVAACQPELYSEIIHEKILKTTGLRKLMQLIADIMADEDAVELKDLLAMLAAGDGVSGDDLCRAIGRVVSAPLRSYGALANIAAHLSSNTRGNGAADTEKYGFIGPMCDMMMRVSDGREWLYIDKHGSMAIPGRFAGAGDFAEGRAVVETPEGYGLIDLTGRYVIEPQCDDIKWDSIANVAVVTVDGRSGLYSREGEPLTGLIYDQILPGAEGLFPVRIGGKYGYVRRDGVMAVRPQFDDAFGFRGGFARVSTANREFLIDTDGRRIDDVQTEAVKAGV